MWLMESDGDVLESKRVWLRPGKTYLFGRTHSRSNGKGKGIKVEHSTISRKHATIHVELPEPGSASSLTARSALKIEDLGSKHGTFVGEKKLSGESLTLQGDQHSFRLGGLEQTFSIKWHSVVFTFKNPSKEKERKFYRETRELLEPLDIKVIDRFDQKETTHVVTNKRNTPQTLQALVHAKYIVDNAVLKELEYVTTEDNLDEPESMSRLEVDFDGSWPDPMKFLPAANREPVPRSETYFKPDETRKDVFHGYTFVMFDKKQYDSLQPAIVGGGGRARLHELKLGQSTSADIIRILKSEFEAAESRVEGSGYGVLHVRFNVADPTYETWAVKIQTESVAAMGQALVEQNEFLDAILTKNVKGLIRKIDVSSGSASGFRAEIVSGRSQSMQSSQGVSMTQQPRSQVSLPSQASASSIHANSDQMRAITVENSSSSAPNEEPQAQGEQTAAALRRNRRGRTRVAATKAFQGFVDDDFEQDMPSTGLDVKEDGNVSAAEPQPRGTDVDESSAIEDDNAMIRSPRKRPIPPDIESLEDVNARLYPGQAAAKKRRLETGEAVESTDQDAVTTSRGSPSEKGKRVSRANPEVKYEAQLRDLREKQEATRDEDLEPMHDQLERMTFAEKQSLVRIEEFEVKPRQRNLADSQARDIRWNDEWDGRKNFKGFVKQGQSAAVRSGPRVIIATEPIPVESATEQYLASKQTEAERRKSRSVARTSEDEAESLISQDYTDANTHQEEVPAELLGDGGPEVIDIDAPRTTRARDKKGSTTSRAQTTAASLKRQASTSTKGPTKKKGRLNLPTGDDEASSEEDDIPKFRFKKK